MKVNGCYCCLLCEAVADAGVVHTKNRNSATMLGLVKRQSAFTAVQDLKSRADFELAAFKCLIYYFNLCSCIITSLLCVVCRPS